jgi:hypothetical protein
MNAQTPCKHEHGIESYQRVNVAATIIQLGSCRACGQEIARRYTETGRGTGPWTVLSPDDTLSDWQEGADDALNDREKRTEHGEYAKGYTYVVLSRALRVIA